MKSGKAVAVVVASLAVLVKNPPKGPAYNNEEVTL